MATPFKPPQGATIRALWLFTLLAASATSQAAPYLPQSNSEVVQKLPSYAVSQTNALPLEDSIARANELLEKAKTESDPRAAAIALSLLTNWEDSQSNELNLIRAGLLQYQHNFDGAVEQLSLLTNGRSPDPRALLLRANIHIVQGRYPDAEADCAALLRISDTAVSATCLSITQSLNGNLAKSYAALNSFSQRFENSEPAVQQWMASSLAEMAIRLGQSPENHWDKALSFSNINVPLQLEKSRWLIHDKQNSKAKDTLLALPASLSRDVLLARASDGETNALNKRLELAELADGENAHAREYAEFLLYVAQEPQKASEKALQNWQQQREPIDLLILSQAAELSGNKEAKAAVSDFLSKTGIEDIRLSAIGGKS